MEKTRYFWVDNVKILATFLVAFCHMLMGLSDAGIFGNVPYPETAINAIYLFHVPLFFICSGFLYQRLTEKQTFKSYSKNIIKKLLALGIPYFVFSAATYFLKVIFSSSVNNNYNVSLLRRLFVYPMAPYWYLFSLFLLFVITPILKGKTDAVLRLILAAGMFIVFASCDFSALPRFAYNLIELTFGKLIWFVIGMEIAYFRLDEKFKIGGCVLFIVFIALFAVKAFAGVDFIGFELILGVLACAGIISLIGTVSPKDENPKALSFAAKYTLPVFLMHTIFAAATRAVLIKIGITSLVLHLAAGTVASFIFPVIAAIIMEKIRLDFLYQPTKYIKIK